MTASRNNTITPTTEMVPSTGWRAKQSTTKKGVQGRSKSVETAPLDAAEYYRFDLDLAKVTEVWRRGSVITSWLLDLTAEAYLRDPQLDEYSGHVSDSGEGRWTINAAIDEGVPVPVLSAALFQRFSSRGRDDVANKVAWATAHELDRHPSGLDLRDVEHVVDDAQQVVALVLKLHLGTFAGG